MSTIPDISVITATYNACASIKKCLLSVASQTGVSIEHIVIDGGSQDGTVDILREHDAGLAYWCSEPDGGIADAMNKGVARATGEWVIFIHADDCLADPGVLAQALNKITLNADVAVFPVFFGTESSYRLVRPKPVSYMTNFKMGMCHQGMLVRNELFRRIGSFDTSFKVCMDYEHILRALRNGARLITYEAPVLSCMSDGGISSRLDWPAVRRRMQEEKRVNERYAQSRLLRGILRVYWSLYIPYRRLRAWIHEVGLT
ncbi:glycosyltransferase family 2 protein [Dyella sp. 2HG41-7]|uniref:glycosyltransferase family 2 protein n=1 Tax=Dyella sp. 2HG41-7 TaxID=2883239 RepID=UPI001F3E392E|nr:glycosyltransferase family 2 protein [Dyella sp. 2HG41-7]